MMINKDVEQITKDDLLALIENEVIERKTIEYKQALPGNSDKEKKEFLADVSSFANASGGDLIYGITEDKETGKPKSLEGLDITNVDREILRLDNIIRTGIQPRLPSVTISPSIPLDNIKVALIIRIQKSWVSPHRVIHNDKFYSRSSNGKYPLDVSELRNAFNLSETVTERVRDFRLDRISKILANELPVPLYSTAKIVLHLIPINSFSLAQNYDIGRIASEHLKMKPIYCSGWNDRYNLYGILAYSGGRENKSHSYVQLFRNGIIEAVEGPLLESNTGHLVIPSIAYEHELIKSFAEYMLILKDLNVDPPIFVFLTMLEVKGYSMAIDKQLYWSDELHTIDENILMLPEIVVDNYDISADRILKPCFDTIWNACGFPRDLYFNDEGKWVPPRYRHS